jgi:hypothetical protein
MRAAQILALLSGIACTTAPAMAENLNLKDGRHWITVASSQDKDQAIGIARLYGKDARVVSSLSGWFGVALGPVKDKSLAAFVKRWEGWPEIPKDAVFSNGAKYTGTVWQPDLSVLEAAEFSPGKPATVSHDGYAVTATLAKDDNGQIATLEGTHGADSLFQLSTPKDEYGDYGNTLRLMPLDPETPAPEAILTQNTGGAHCCVATWFASETDPGKWQLLDSNMLDGEGYWLEDVDGDGSYELMSVDNAFLYAFDSYAGSIGPLVISQLRGEEIEPVAKDDVWRARKQQELAGLEYFATLEPDNWKANGFLAAWVAVKIQLGEGEEAWAKMLKSYDKASDFGPQICTSGETVENCPVENLKAVPFPEALASFLEENHYLPVPHG